MDNWIYEGATCDICEGCTANPYDTAYDCVKNHREDCPYREQLELIETLSENLLRNIAKVVKVSHVAGEPYEIDPTGLSDVDDMREHGRYEVPMINGMKVGNW